VGVGTSTPTQKMEVTGNLKATGVCIGNDCRSAWPQAEQSWWVYNVYWPYFSYDLISYQPNGRIIYLNNICDINYNGYGNDLWYYLERKTYNTPCVLMNVGGD
jgi:hypothetical protein